VGRIEGASLLDSTTRRAELDDEMVKAAFDTRHLLRFVYVKCDGPLQAYSLHAYVSSRRLHVSLYLRLGRKNPSSQDM
jgi:hypothetical protein